MNQSIRLRTPAKINLYLRVVGRRPDGYHELETLFQTIDLFDDLVLEKAQGATTISVPGHRDLEGNSNLIIQAIELLERTIGSPLHVNATLQKRIPIAGGLGGGSSDCAAALIGTNALFNLGLDDFQLSYLALRLGADVPFFLRGGTAVGRGIGEVLTPITLPMDYWIILANPGIPVSTKQVFTEFSKDLTRTRSPGNLAGRISADADLCDLLHNDLATAAERLFPQIGRLKRQLLGCGVRAALMSGSGPTLFGIGSRIEVERAAREMPEGTVVALTRPISYGILID